jgi:hypothetical protein
MAEPTEHADDVEGGADLATGVGSKLIRAMKIAREVLPGDSRYGDPLSTTGSAPRRQVARRLGEAAQSRPGILKEAGLSALQVWEAVSEGESTKLGDDRLAIVFTDLVGFSDWAWRPATTSRSSSCARWPRRSNRRYRATAASWSSAWATG